MQPKAMTVLYLGVLDDTPVQDMKLAGARRYAEARGWEVVSVPVADSTPQRIPALLARHRPVGCIVECFGNESPLQPPLFGRVPAVWMDAPSGGSAAVGFPAVSVDEKAVAATALRELSATRPKSFAVVEFRRTLGSVPSRWSRFRAETFRSLASSEGRECEVFEDHVGEASEARAARLAGWLAARPRPCGVFAVNDGVASEVRAACRAARLHITRDISIIGVDNDKDFCETEMPTLSSIQIDFERAGYVAAKMLGGMVSRRAAERAEPQRGESNVGLRASAVSAPPREMNPIPIGPLLAVRRRSTSGRGRREPHILEAVEMIRREACDGLTAATLTKRFPGTKQLFNLRFREATGHSVLDEILHVRLEKACTLLADTEIAIGAIYSYCGFRTHWALDFHFHVRFGMPMLEWRRRNRRQ